MPARATPSGGRFARRWLLALAGAGAALGALLVLETALRLAPGQAPALRDEAAAVGSWFELSPSRGWVLRPGFTGALYGSRREVSGSGLLRQDETPGAGPRVVALGDSRTFGFGLPRESAWPERLQARLNGVEVVNLAVPGYSAVQCLAAFREQALALRPRLVLVAVGFNDRRYVLAGEQDGPERFGRLAAAAPWLRFQHRLAGVRLAGLLQRIAPRDVDLLAVVPRVGSQAYRRELATLAAEARRAGARALFVQLGDNPRQLRVLAEGRAAARAGDWRRAADRFAAAAHSATAFSDLARLAWAEALARLSEHDRRRPVTRVPLRRSLHGGTPIRAESEYARALRAAAREGGALRVDLRPALAANAEVFTDYCHFDARGQELVAERVYEAIRAHRLLADVGEPGVDPARARGN